MIQLQALSKPRARQDAEVFVTEGFKEAGEDLTPSKYMALLHKGHQNEELPRDPL